jgi:hypothetical protein
VNLPVESWCDIDNGIGLGAGKEPDVPHRMGRELGNRRPIGKSQVVTSQGIDGIEGCTPNDTMIRVAHIGWESMLGVMSEDHVWPKGADPSYQVAS